MEKILFICGLIPKDYNIINNTMNFMNTASDVFSNQFINGLKENGKEVTVLSAPFIGSYPINYKKAYYTAKCYNDGVEYVSFFNLWGIRNYFRYWALKKSIKKNRYYNIDKVIIYSVHTPFANLAKYIKSKNPSSCICLITPDLPEFMNLREKKSLLYKIGKKFDCKSFYNKICYFDCFCLVSKHQNEKVNIFNRKSIVIEAIAKESEKEYYPTKNKVKQIVYTGTLNKKFGILNLIEALYKVCEDCELIICGNGDAVEDIKSVHKENKKIRYLGEVNHEEVRKIQKNADILVNPRQNNQDYTRYSFPSKVMEYLSTGRPVICYKLDGIPDEYNSHLIYPTTNDVDGLARTIDSVLKYDDEKLKNIFFSNTEFLRNLKDQKKSVNRLLELLNNVQNERGK